MSSVNKSTVCVVKFRCYQLFTNHFIVTMETCVLIPAEFSLMLRPRDSFLHLVNGLKSVKSRQNPAEKKTETEAGVCVYSNQLIRKGACFLPFQGTIRLDRLEVYSLLNDDDVSTSATYFNHVPCVCECDGWRRF